MERVIKEVKTGSYLWDYALMMKGFLKPLDLETITIDEYIEARVAYLIICDQEKQEANKITKANKSRNKVPKRKK